MIIATNTTAVLYPKQEELVNALVKTYNTPNHISDQHLYITGEMGVGKTYMASALAHKLHAKNVLIISPKTVTTKWQKVFNQFNPELHLPGIVTTKHHQIIDPQTNVTIVTPQHLTQHLTKKFTDIDFKKLELLVNQNIKGRHNNDIYRNFYYSLIDSIQTNDLIDKQHHYDLVIFDEIHTFKAQTKPFLGLIFLNLCQHNKILNLTGTIYNQNLSYLANLLMLTNPRTINYAISANLAFSDAQYIKLVDILHRSDLFFSSIFKYIAGQISLTDVKENTAKSTDNIQQTIVPPIAIDLSNEQQTWVELAKYQLNHLQRSAKKTDEIINNYLDQPSQEQPTITTHKRTDYAHSFFESIKTMRKAVVGLQLTPIELEQTPKYQQVLKIKKDRPAAKSLIFVNNNKLCKALAKSLPKTKSLPAKLKASQYSDYINNCLKTDTDFIIVTPRQISVGIDITEADQIIWYQIPDDVAKIIQAQRRIYRLTSTKSSRIYYLYYTGTYQEEIIKQVSQASVKNAGSYNVRSTDNLAKITSILLPQIK